MPPPSPSPSPPPPDQSLKSLTKQDRLVYDVIISRKNMAIWLRNLKQETRLTGKSVRESTNTLLDKNLIKLVVPMKKYKKPREYYMGSEFEPAEEIFGGFWYNDGALDTDFISLLKDQCLKTVSRLRVATLEQVTEAVRRSGFFTVELKDERVEEILRALVLDDEVAEVSSGGKVCFKSCGKKSGRFEQRVGGVDSIPCGVCPVMQRCTPGGLVSPESCKYYSDWLSF